jgi:hypothetical protein
MMYRYRRYRFNIPVKKKKIGKIKKSRSRRVNCYTQWKAAILNQVLYLRLSCGLEQLAMSTFAEQIIEKGWWGLKKKKTGKEASLKNLGEGV